MVVSSLEEMETIVNKNKALSWEGWDVVVLKKTPGAMLDPNGAYINGQWFLKNTFKASEIGWEIPDKLMR